MKNLVIVALLAVIAVGGVLAVRAQDQGTVTVGVAVWEEKTTGSLYASILPQGGTWKTQTIDDPLDMRFTESRSGRFWRSNIISLTVPVTIDYDAWRTGNPPWRWEASCTLPVGRTGSGGGYATVDEAHDAGWAWVDANCISETDGPEPLEPHEVIVTPASR